MNLDNRGESIYGSIGYGIATAYAKETWVRDHKKIYVA